MSGDNNTGQDDNYLEMSDEDIANMELPPEPTTETDDGASSETTSDDTDDSVKEGEDDGEAGKSESGTGSESESGTEGDTGGEGDSTSEESASDSGKKQEAGETGGTEGSTSESGQSTTDDSSESGQSSKEELDSHKTSETVKSEKEVDYKAKYEALMAPFKANGREMTLRSEEEARRLMSMGSNYHHKMAELKPNMKILKMLDNNGILDEEKLSNLIDLSKKDPAAITQLIKDSGINPLEIDVEKDSGYKSKTYTVSDSEVDLDRYLQEVQATETGERTIDIMSNEWDAASKQRLAKDPAILTAINDHVANGLYDQITAEVNRAKSLGEYTGISTLDAYEQMARQMQADGKFVKKEVTKTTSTSDTATTTSTKVVPTEAEKLQLKTRKSAASSTKSKPGSKKTYEKVDILNMSDEDFEKLELPT